MVDSLLFNLEKAKKPNILEQLGLTQKTLTGHSPMNSAYCLLTLHRPSNVDNKESFLKIIYALTEISKRIPVIFPAHPRTRKQIEAFKFKHFFVNFTHDDSPITNNRVHLVDPLGYLDFLKLMIHSKFVMTDSGGIQEETTVLGIPCLTLRDTTERPATITNGSNVLVCNNTDKIIEEAFKIIDGREKKGNCPEMWDGKAGERIVDILAINL